MSKPLGRNKQPFYCRLEVIFTATEDLTEAMNSPPFRERLEDHLFKSLSKTILTDSLVVESADAEAGDPADLL